MPRGTRSHLFTAITVARPASWAYPAMWASCAVRPSLESMTRTATWHRSRLLSAMTTASFSSGSLTRPLRPMPAVSISTYRRPSRVNGVCPPARVVTGAAEDLSDLNIEPGRALSRVDDEEDDVGLVDGHQHLTPHALDERLDGRGIEPARVDHRRLPALELHAAVEPVARHAGHVAHQGLPAPDEPVEERRLSNIRPADDGEGRPELRGLHGGLSQQRSQQSASGRLDDADGNTEVPGKIGRGDVVEEDAVAVTHRHGGDEHLVTEAIEAGEVTLDVLPGQESRHRDRAAEEIVRDGYDVRVHAARDQRREPALEARSVERSGHDGDLARRSRRTDAPKRAVELVLEAAHQADAVLGHGESLVGVGLGERGLCL